MTVSLIREEALSAWVDLPLQQTLGHCPGFGGFSGRCNHSVSQRALSHTLLHTSTTITTSGPQCRGHRGLSADFVTTPPPPPRSLKSKKSGKRRHTVVLCKYELQCTEGNVGTGGAGTNSLWGWKERTCSSRIGGSLLR